MKVSCLQDRLSKGLSIVGRAVTSRSVLPVLSNILVATDESRIKLSATNLEIAINCWIGGRVDEEGATTVPARLLTEFVSSMPRDNEDRYGPRRANPDLESALRPTRRAASRVSMPMSFRSYRPGMAKSACIWRRLPSGA